MAMNYFGKFLYNFKEFYNEINSATLTGAIDVVVVQQDDGSYLCSPFHVRFGKLGVLRSREKVVDIEINTEPIDIHMKLGESGEAFFVEEVEDVMVPMHLATSPIPTVPDIKAELEQMKMMHGERMNRRELESSLEVSGSWKDSKLMHAYLNTSSESAERSKEDTSSDQIPQQSLEVSEFDTLHTPWIYNESKIDSESLAIQIDECENEDLIKASDKLDQSDDYSQKSASFYVTDSLILCSVSAELSPSSKTSTNESETKSATKIPIISRDTQDSLRDREMRMSHSDTAISNITLTNKTSNSSPREQVIESDKIRKKKRRKKLSKSSKDNSVPTDKTVESEQVTGCSETEILIHEHSNISDTIFDMEVSDGEGPYTPSVVVRTASMPALCEDSVHWNFKSTTHFNIHPFSDGDVTPVISSPAATRPPSPKSDSEYEKRTHDATCQTGEEEIKWCWGKLPESTTPSGKSKEHDVRKSDKKEKHTSFGSMIPFRQVNKKLPENEGIYLDDLNFDDLDPEIAALYFPRSNARQIQTIKDTSRDDDAESGNGPSLPQSPHSVEGSIGGSRMVDSDGESKQSLYEYNSYTMSDITLSLCGGLKGVEGNLPPDRFVQSLITYEDFVKNPNVLFNPDLVIRIDGKFYNWQIAGPIIMCLLVFQRQLPENALNSLIKEHLPKKRSRMSSWFSWRKSPSTADVKKSTESIQSNPSSSPTSVTNSPRKTTDVDRIKEEAYISTSSENEGDIHDETMKRPIKERKFTTGQERFKKSLRLTSDQIAELNLKQGVNEVVFSVTTQYQGTSRCKCHLYLWRYDDKIVISDIDGTITKSDVLGHILPIIGRDWAQSGVAQLFTSIKRNGYQFLYLSARAIGQAKITREYLKSIKQGDVSLPEGPLLLSPSSLISALHREVIEKKPEEFKISCLRDIQALFPATRNPFYAGYGNKINDVWAYRAVGIPISRIFTINHRGVLKHELTQTFQSSYFKLQEIVDHVFPPLSHHQLGEVVLAEFNFDASEEYSSFNYWRNPLPDIQIEITSSYIQVEDSQPSTSKT